VGGGTCDQQKNRRKKKFLKIKKEGQNQPPKKTPEGTEADRRGKSFPRQMKGRGSPAGPGSKAKKKKGPSGVNVQKKREKKGECKAIVGKKKRSGGSE